MRSEMKKGLESDMESLSSVESAHWQTSRRLLNQMIADKQDEMETLTLSWRRRRLAARQAQALRRERRPGLLPREAQNLSSSSREAAPAATPIPEAVPAAMSTGI